MRRSLRDDLAAVIDEIDDAVMLAKRAEEYRIEYNQTRPHEAIAWNRPKEVHLGLADPTIPNPGWLRPYHSMPPTAGGEGMTGNRTRFRHNVPLRTYGADVPHFSGLIWPPTERAWCGLGCRSGEEPCGLV
jgi:hypothetical protein